MTQKCHLKSYGYNRSFPEGDFLTREMQKEGQKMEANCSKCLALSATLLRLEPGTYCPLFVAYKGVHIFYRLFCIFSNLCIGIGFCLFKIRNYFFCFQISQSQNA